MDWVEAEGKTKEEAEAKLLETLGETDLDKLEVESLKVKRMFLGMGGRTIKLRGRLLDAPPPPAPVPSAPPAPAPEKENDTVSQPEETTPQVAESESQPEAADKKSVPVVPGNGVVTGASLYRPWAAEGPSAIILPPEGKGYARRIYDPNPSMEDDTTEEESDQNSNRGNQRETEPEEEFVPPVYEDLDDSPVSVEDRDRAVEFVAGVIDKMNMGGSVKGFRLADRLLIQIDSDNGGLLIGRKGLTLDSLQYLTDIIINKGREGRIRIILDTEYYKERRRFKVLKIATTAADKAARIHKPVRLFPMSPNERQMIHSSLADDDRVETISEGEGNRRRVVVFPRDKRPDLGNRR